jgi:hypothetical protein
LRPKIQEPHSPHPKSLARRKSTQQPCTTRTQLHFTTHKPHCQHPHPTPAIQADTTPISPIAPYPDGQFRASSIAASIEISKIPREQASPAFAIKPALDGCRIGQSVGGHRRMPWRAVLASPSSVPTGSRTAKQLARTAGTPPNPVVSFRFF